MIIFASNINRFDNFLKVVKSLNKGKGEWLNNNESMKPMNMN